MTIFMQNRQVIFQVALKLIYYNLARNVPILDPKTQKNIKFEPMYTYVYEIHIELSLETLQRLHVIIILVQIVKFDSSQFSILLKSIEVDSNQFKKLRRI